MMDALLAIAAGGLLLGLAGSLHCACMCGGIASGALFLLNPSSSRERITQLLLLQAGRITTYSLAGGAVASVASLAIDPNLTAGTFRALQWLAAIVLMWMGLSMAGMLPRLSLAVGGMASVPGTLSAAFGNIVAPLRGHPRAGPFALGLSWGLTPCPMVYAALFSAALTGSFSHGALWMAAFGAGTLPGVLSAALGVSALTRLRRGPGAEIAAGLAIAALGFASLYFGWPTSSILCVTP